MKVKYEDRQKQKVIAITTDTLVVGVDIAKNYQWARFVDFRGIEHDRALKFKNSKGGFETILARIREICKKENFAKAVVGMEPTGHYWKAFANWLEKQDGIKAVLVNPYATKQAKELDDNSQTKSDKKDALTIAKLVKDGRYFELYLPHDVYAELRGLSTTRTGLNKRKNALKNTITAVMDEYFPEYGEVFKCPLSGKASRHILKTCPFPKFILELGEDGVTDEIKKAVKKTVGRKKAAQLIETAKESIGVDYGEEAALQKTDYAGFLLSIKGIGVVTLAACLGELGNPARFENPRQMSRMAGYNLVEDSSGKNKSGTKISKRGRKNLRSVLYQMALIMVATNDEMKQLYHYLKTREEAPLRKMQALIVVSKKILALIHALAKKKENYDPGKVFGPVRREQLKAAA
ncbi:hypothetical protein IMSAGC012_03494 [Lachnospiraceae bacterium]|nr:hypothetical protein IMSAGC012_03494 [Lachnospiraceae bacterium]